MPLSHTGSFTVTDTFAGDICEMSPVPAIAGDGAKVQKYLQVINNFLFDVNFTLVHFFTLNFVQT